ncbi:hypothetical protein CBO47_00265 [Bordetella pertussis]|nr:hypothetical protein WU05_00275 [Bordetella pertussis]AQC37591.1 hypothetical protein WU39_00265 [Bordetella pertussis]ASR57105.1 hypothetical protein CBO47_00265 [Bordetella pertussis]ASR64349.1 hypothetical protein CBO48_00265 [Bordetella pertussis]ASR69750.1 hypothetical protein CF509_00265 [Bordetella pertussis]
MAQYIGAVSFRCVLTSASRRGLLLSARCEDSIGCMHGSSEPDLRNWKSPTPQFTQGARPDEHP